MIPFIFIGVRGGGGGGENAKEVIINCRAPPFSLSWLLGGWGCSVVETRFWLVHSSSDQLMGLGDPRRRAWLCGRQALVVGCNAIGPRREKGGWKNGRWAWENLGGGLDDVG
jgi:hypothetical protein